MNRKQRRQAARQGGAAAAAPAAGTGPEPAALIAQALDHHRRGELGAAQRLYRQVLAARPDHPDALHLMGMIAYQVGELPTARDLVGRAIKHNPRVAAYHNNLGEVLRALGEADAAVRAYRQALSLDPAEPGPAVNLVGALIDAGRADEAVREAEALAARAPDAAPVVNSLGSAHLAAGDPAAAEPRFARAVELAPEVPEAHYNLGNALQQQGRASEAADAYRRALELRPGYAVAHTNLGSALLALGDVEAALDHFNDALVHAPDLPEAHVGLGDALAAAGRRDEAVDAYRAALERDPEAPGARYRLAAALIELDRPAEAEAALEPLLADAPEHAPGDAYVLNLAGVAAAEQGRLDDAVARYRAAAEADPTYVEPAANLGDALLERGDDDEARTWYAAASERDPYAGGVALRAATALPVIMDSREAIAEARARMAHALAALGEEGLHLADPLRELGAPPFRLACHGEDDRPLQEALAGLVAQASPELGFIAPHALEPPRDPEAERLRIGFVSRHFADHPVGRLNLGLVERLDRARFEVVVLPLAPADDPVAHAFAGAADRALPLPPDLAAMQEAIAAQELDVLYFADVGLEPASYLLAFARLAPIQCVAWGHPATTGIATLDHFLSAADLETGDAQAHYAETLVALDTPAVSCRRPEPSPVPLERADLGLAPDQTVYLCPQPLFALHPDFDPILQAILDGDPAGVLALIEPPHPRWRERLMARFERTMPAVAARVRFLSPQVHADRLHVLAAADVVLDPPHFSGAETTLDALAMGTPVLTLPGPCLRGRFAYAWYRRMGVMDWVAADAGDYAAKALALGTDPAAREAARARIDAASPALFENRAALAALEGYFLDTARERR